MLLHRLSAFKFVSYLAYLLPFLFALYVSSWATALVVVIAVIGGFLYHWFDERRFLYADAAACTALVVWDFKLCFDGNFQEPYFAIAVILTAVALYYYLYRQRRGPYSYHHGMWHVYGALITLFCIFTFAL